MAPKVFLTGVTGYIGGEAFYALYKAHPEYEYSLLVRNEERGKVVSEAYPKVRLVYGSLDSADVLEKEAADADIVLHTADSADNVPSAKAISKGIAAGHSEKKPGYWIHICGTGILQWYDQKHKRYGQAPLPEQKYADIADIDRILNLPDEADHRNVDKIVLPTNDAPGVRTAIVAPPTIYGPGRGPGNQRSQQVNAMARFLLHNGFAPIIEPGLTEWDNVHVQDLSAFLVTLVEATQDASKNADPELFGPRAYYFLETGRPHLWADVAKWLAAAAQKNGLMAEAKTEMLTQEKCAEMIGSKPEYISMGLNSKSVAERARKYFGWEARHPPLEDTIEDTLLAEMKAMKIQPTGGHKH